MTSHEIDALEYYVLHNIEKKLVCKSLEKNIEKKLEIIVMLYSLNIVCSEQTYFKTSVCSFSDPNSPPPPTPTPIPDPQPLPAVTYQRDAALRLLF